MREVRYYASLTYPTWAADIDYQGEITHYLKAGKRISR